MHILGNGAGRDLAMGSGLIPGMVSQMAPESTPTLAVGLGL